MAKIILDNVAKKYDKNSIYSVKPLNLTMEDGEFIVIVGPSGCGKSTTLRMIAGLETITEGELYIGDQLVNDVDSKDRDIAMVFQNYALYPHMSVFDNIAFPLESQGMKKSDIKDKVNEVAEILQLEDLLKRRPRQLSGGQRQRVALGRAMVREPKVFLLDEPLSNLDAKLRVNMRHEIVNLHQRLQTTFIYVTHDQTEAMTMGDRIIVLNEGNLEQIDTPTNLYFHPESKFVAEFIGTPEINMMEAVLKVDTADELSLKIGDYEFKVSEQIKSRLKQYNNDTEVYFGFRPQDAMITNAAAENAILINIGNSEVLGAETNIYFTIPDFSAQYLATMPTEQVPDAKDNLYLKINHDKIYLFDKETEKTLLMRV